MTSSTPISKIAQWESNVFPFVLEQYKVETLSTEKAEELGCTSRWQACLKAVIDSFQYIDDASVELSTLLDFEHNAPTGKYLDWLAGLAGVTRMAGETDAELYTRAFDSNYDDAGTADYVIRMAKYFSGTESIEDVHYMNEVPATFFVYTPEGSQIKRRQVRKIAPGAVNGFPGAAIQFADGSLMGDADNNVFLAVANDAEIEADE